jgi:hypothetical protein
MHLYGPLKNLWHITCTFHSRAYTKPVSSEGLGGDLSMYALSENAKGRRGKMWTIDALQLHYFNLGAIGTEIRKLRQRRERRLEIKISRSQGSLTTTTIYLCIH